MRKYIIIVAIATSLYLNPHTVTAATLPSGFQEIKIISGLTQPTAMAFAPDGRLFVTEQSGKIRIIKNATTTPQLLAAPFFTLSVTQANEQGLLGIAIDPNFSTNNFIYIYYTIPTSPIHNRVSRITAQGDIAVPGSQTTILELGNLSTAKTHNGGGLQFGPDGKLYIGVGDNRTSANAQNLTNLLGKVLRINPDGTVPTDNPFVGQAGNRGEIWAYGFRNPFTFGIDPGNGTVLINDVGENTWEEISMGVKGGNFGWPTCEGICNNPLLINPHYQYDHSQGVAVTGGAFYRATSFPIEYRGVYFFSDYSRDWIRFMDLHGTRLVTPFATGVAGAVDLDIGPDGSLYSLGIMTGELFRYQYTLTPSITISPSTSCPQKSNGDADCKKDPPNNKDVSLIDFEIWRKERFANCTLANISACTPDEDGDSSLMDANYNFVGSGAATTDTIIDSIDFEIWRRGYFL